MLTLDSDHDDPNRLALALWILQWSRERPNFVYVFGAAHRRSDLPSGRAAKTNVACEVLAPFDYELAWG